MGFYRAICELGNDSEELADTAVNVWHFSGDTGNAGTTEEADIIAGALGAFYLEIDGVILSSALNNVLRIRVYDLLDPTVRVPIHDELFALTVGGSQFPNEVAICLSFRAPLESGQNRRRTRGRIFLGPIVTTAAASRTGDQMVDTAETTQLLTAVGNLNTALDAGTPHVVHGVFSRYDALNLAVGSDPPSQEPSYQHSELVAGFKEVTHYWVDNALDTQRRRGRRATTRTTLNITP